MTNRGQQNQGKFHLSLLEVGPQSYAPETRPTFSFISGTKSGRLEDDCSGSHEELILTTLFVPLKGIETGDLKVVVKEVP